MKWLINSANPLLIKVETNVYVYCLFKKVLVKCLYDPLCKAIEVCKDTAGTNLA